ncbi:MAG: ATP-binding protein [Thiothrix sp.]|uniref:hybrid sensor histidine kinase/response regulator n=1 Tax=Thiothrix sp. TaxID=1032 RepID=UPI002603856C|nr:ATP-binding protein [Thiothrix sp.]MDD5391491.1 ATP-binding protein [Thiothrix sp.]
MALLSQIALDERIRLERTNASLGVVGATLGAAVLFAFYPQNNPTAHLIGWWFLLQVVVCGTWLAFASTYTRYLVQARRLWPYISTATSTLSGLIWGIGWELFSHSGNDTVTIMFTVALIAVVAGGVMATIFHLPTMFAFVGCSVIPTMFSALAQNSIFYPWFAVGTPVFTFVCLTFGLNVHYFLMNTLEQREKNSQLAQQLAHEKQQAEQANQDKTRFLAAASHDLRQPLQAMHFFQYALGDLLTNPSEVQILDKLKESTTSLADLLDSLLDISKLDAGTVDIRPHAFPVDDLLGPLYYQYSIVAANAGLSMHYVPSSVYLYSDPKQLERVIQNLIVNAIRHMGQKGRIVLGGRRHNGKFRIEVWDNGVGIPASKLGEVFREFYQLNNPERNRNKGLGLGLSIVKRLLDLLGHEINVRSTPGKATIFSVTVPLAKPTPLLHTADFQHYFHDKPEKSGRVLVIEDDENVADSLKMLLEIWGYEAITTPTVTPAVLADCQHIQCIISDYQLEEGQSGIEAIQQLREQAGACIPAILITGNTSPHVSEALKKVDVRISYKPINPKVLKQLLIQVLQPASPPV